MPVDDVAFTISVTGETTKEKWFGEFRALRRLSFRQQMARDRSRREYLGELAQYASGRALEQAVVFADLAVSLTKAPEWWTSSANGQDLCDDNLLEAIWMEVQRIQGNVKKEDEKKTKDDAGVLKKAVENHEAKNEED
jgi:hypothetical protein